MSDKSKILDNNRRSAKPHASSSVTASRGLPLILHPIAGDLFLLPACFTSTQYRISYTETCAAHIFIMAFANIFSSASIKPEDLSTPSGTPPPSSGVQTPIPDAQDKRFPTILSSYFSQVRSSFHPTTKPSNMGTTSPITPLSEDGELEGMVSRMKLEDSAGDGDEATNIPATSEKGTRSCQDANSVPTISRKEAAAHAYPTPPLSSSSSYVMVEKDDTSGDGSSRSTSPAKAGATSPRRRQSALENLSKSLRRSTVSALPSTCTSTPTVLASQISKPKTPNATVARHSVSAAQHLSASLLASEDTRLTEHAATPRNQTPPRTPRTLSHETKPTSQETKTSAPPPSETVRARHGSTDAALMGQPKGKLFLQISSGRGLRPSINPYVVCQFQYNEYISKGPRSDSGNGTDSDASTESLRRGPLRIQRTDSDTAKSMAIPMKNRQSSQTSMSDRDASREHEVTDPVWNHEAVL